MRAALLGILCAGAFAAPEASTLKYRFKKGDKYEDTTERRMELRLGEEAVIVHSTEVLRRTVIAVDETGHPTIERVEVVKFIRTTERKPADSDEWEIKRDIERGTGKIFLWRRMKESWKLFDVQERDATLAHPRVVARLKNWRDGRLPRKPVGLGESWKVSLETFMRTSGTPPPKGVKGGSIFVMVALEDGVADITFKASGSDRADGYLREFVQTGTWRFDVKRGRDLEIKSEGSFSLDGGEKGKGTFSMTRRVRWADQPEKQAPKPADQSVGEKAKSER